MTNNATTRELLNKILLRKAKGYTFKETTDEFSVVDGEKKLVRSKTVTKCVQPDINAIKALIAMDDGEADVGKMTDEQLHSEKLRLIRLLDMVNDSAPDTTDQD